MTLTVLLFAGFALTDWSDPDWNGRGATCETKGGRVTVEVCEVAGRVVSIRCRDSAGLPTECPAWAAELAWRSQ